jgi:hypothetical protein
MFDLLYRRFLLASINSRSIEWTWEWKLSYLAGAVGLALWICLMHGLMIIDVWDETNIFIVLDTPPFATNTFSKSVSYIWTHFLGLYRPLATTILLVGGKWGLGFIELRYVNALFLVMGIGLFAIALKRHFAVPSLWVVIFALLTLTSASTVITIGWFANIFDASCLFFIALGFILILEKKNVWGCIAVGLAFFCKEIAILSIPFLFILKNQNKLSWKSLWIIVASILMIAMCYGFIRQSVVPLGSETDIHKFSKDVFLSSTSIFMESFWLQNTKLDPDSFQRYIGYLFFVFSFLCAPGYKNKLIFTSIFLTSAVAYWGMFAYQSDNVVSSLNFVGRLYLIPSTLILFLLIADRRRIGVLVLAFPIIVGAVGTYRDHVRFQELYQSIFAMAVGNATPLVIDYPEKPLSDLKRQVEIGNYPGAMLAVDTKNARLFSRN